MLRGTLIRLKSLHIELIDVIKDVEAYLRSDTDGGCLHENTEMVTPSRDGGKRVLCLDCDETLTLGAEPAQTEA